jgi:N6-L-threonylcarbamoyladenine synthase
MRVLGIETSCDDTAVAIYDGKLGLIAEKTYNQSEHQKYGGVVPEIASRDHIRKLLPMVDSMLAETNTIPEKLGGIAYTSGPGLVGSLMVGAAVAQSLRLAYKIPAIGVHHLEGHLLAPMLETPAPNYPFVALLVSGGHSMLVAIKKPGEYEILGETLDDAAGEAFDKTAKLLGLPYPGGPHLSKLAESGNPERFAFPRPLISRPGLDFSFSGLKTSVARTIRDIEDTPQNKADIAASFQAAIVETLCIKCDRALKQTNMHQLVIAGGVSANKHLREKINELSQRNAYQVYMPRIKFCTDNAAMIAYAGYLRLKDGQQNDFCIDVRPRWPLTTLAPILA